jgi:predicted carbohydrate-binding protein with CBM5 and CBM33 domain
MMRACTFIVLSVCSLLDLAHSHGAVLFPPPRNAIDSTLAPWKGASIGVNNDQQFPQVQQSSTHRIGL